MHPKISKIPKTVHPESLWNVPLVQQMLTDPHVTVAPRQIDCNWKYYNHLPLTTTGFNPWCGQVFYGQKSAFADWMQDPFSSSRQYNEGDFLVPEAIMLAHDYLHSWSYQAIHNLVPKIQFAQTPLTKKNIEDFVFCHLLTEAVATVGMDYWYLSTIDFNQICNVGTAFTGMTTSYREKDIAEYQRLNKKFIVQSPQFFEDVCYFYCSGQWDGFDLTDLKKSPLLYSWIEHELTYGEAQRRISRQWFSFLAKEDIQYKGKELTNKVDASQPWKKKLIKDLSQLLWRKVKENQLCLFPKKLSHHKMWQAPKNKPKNFRYCNLNTQTLKANHDFGPDSSQNFYYFFYQYISQFDYTKTNKNLLKLGKNLMDIKDLGLLYTVFANEPKLAKQNNEPEVVLILN